MKWQVYCCCSWRGYSGGSGSGKTLLCRSAKYGNCQAFSDARKGIAFYCVPTKVHVSRLFPCLLKSTGQLRLGLLNPSCAFPCKLVRTRGERCHFRSGPAQPRVQDWFPIKGGAPWAFWQARLWVQLWESGYRD